MNLSVLPHILTQAIGHQHKYFKMILICLDRNDYVVYENTENALNDFVSNYSSDGGEEMYFKKSIVSDCGPPMTKKMKLSMVCDDPLSYTKHITETVLNTSGYSSLITKLSFNAYQTEVPFSIAKPTIQQFVDKKIKNSMTKRRPKSKKTMKQEKKLTKQFIQVLK